MVNKKTQKTKSNIAVLGGVCILIALELIFMTFFTACNSKNVGVADKRIKSDSKSQAANNAKLSDGISISESINETFELLDKVSSESSSSVKFSSIFTIDYSSKNSSDDGITYKYAINAKGGNCGNILYGIDTNRKIKNCAVVMNKAKTKEEITLYVIIAQSVVLPLINNGGTKYDLNEFCKIVSENPCNASNPSFPLNDCEVSEINTLDTVGVYSIIAAKKSNGQNDQSNNNKSENQNTGYINDYYQNAQDEDGNVKYSDGNNHSNNSGQVTAASAANDNNSQNRNPCSYGHSWQAATCTEPSKCSVCGTTMGSPLGHNVYITKCRNCNYTDLSKITGSYSNITSYDSKTGERYAVQDVNIDGGGTVSFGFKGNSYSVKVVPVSIDAQTQSENFDCYIGGQKSSNAKFRANYDSSGRVVLHLTWNGINSEGNNLYFFVIK